MVTIDFNQFSTEELIQLNKDIVNHVKLRRERESQSQMNRFDLGDTVSFETQEGKIVTGEIIRFNKKSVTIVTDDKDQWRVHPKYITKVLNARPSQLKKDLNLLSFQEACLSN